MLTVRTNSRARSVVILFVPHSTNLNFQKRTTSCRNASKTLSGREFDSPHLHKNKNRMAFAIRFLLSTPLFNHRSVWTTLLTAPIAHFVSYLAGRMRTTVAKFIIFHSKKLIAKSPSIPRHLLRRATIQRITWQSSIVYVRNTRRKHE